MNVSEIANVVSSIDSFFNKRNSLAVSIEKSFKNKKMIYFRSLLINIYILTITPLTILVFLNRNYLDSIITNDILLNIIKSILIVFDAIPMTILFVNLTRIDYYFSCPEFRKAKKEIYSENSGFRYDKTKIQHRRFKRKRIKSYFIENLMPCLIIAVIVFIMYNYSLHNLIASIGIIILFSLSISTIYEREHSIRFYIYDVKSNIDDKQLLGRELIRIDNLSFYISNNDYDAYYYENNKWYLLKYKSSKFEKEDIILFKTYLDEYTELLNEFKKSDKCKDKQELSIHIKEFEKILKKLNELV